MSVKKNRKSFKKFMVSIKRYFNNVEVKIWFLLLKSLTLEYTLAKQISCRMYTP